MVKKKITNGWTLRALAGQEMPLERGRQFCFFCIYIGLKSDDKMLKMLVFLKIRSPHVEKTYGKQQLLKSFKRKTSKHLMFLKVVFLAITRNKPLDVSKEVIILHCVGLTVDNIAQLSSYLKWYQMSIRKSN